MSLRAGPWREVIVVSRMHVSGIFVHPVKSLRGFAVPTAEIDELGIVGDRRFLVVDDEGRFLTQRQHPHMARVATALNATTLTLSAPGAGSVSVPRMEKTTRLRKVQVWKSEGLEAQDCGNEVARWLSAMLSLSCHLVRIGPEFHRPMTKPGKALPGDVVSFADGYPFLIVSEASLADLNDRLAARGEEPVPMDRFRPNFVVAGCRAFEEDTWTRFRIGDVVFRAGGPCGRCVITTTDQVTCERGKEPLRTLASYRRDATDPTDVNFGQNLIHETKSGAVRVGDKVEVLSAGS